ncbi:MAG TPA: glycoside hydrolase family 27 protein, partial [Candidatus Angelobacter sp.]|nr:glycoside hydrolase family 27 protein [Candidatus Angelobacter sp.]
LTYSNEEMPTAYKKMGDALTATGRPIIYSLSQYGREDVWKWGAKVGANLWRTTQDIVPTIQSIMAIGFLEQTGLESYAGPGHWNDPDMLEVGNGLLTLDENKLHFTIWAMLAAPLIAGNNLSEMSPEIREILTNREIIDVDQDALGIQGHRLRQEGPRTIWVKPLSGGDIAVALFNLGESPRNISVNLHELGITRARRIRDLWNHKDLDSSMQRIEAEVPVHGVACFRIYIEK